MTIPRSEGVGNYWNLKKVGAVCAGEGCSEEAVDSGRRKQLRGPAEKELGE